MEGDHVTPPRKGEHCSSVLLSHLPVLPSPSFGPCSSFQATAAVRQVGPES